MSFPPSQITFANAKFEIVVNGSSPNRFIWLHGDEQTAKMALEYHIKTSGNCVFY